MRFPCFLIMLLFLSATFNVFSQNTSPLQTIVDDWTNQKLLENAGIGIYVIDVESGKELASTDPQLSLVPASTLKLLTTGAALEILGADYRFKTQLAYSGEIKNDTLFGDIVITGGGDPALGSHYFEDHYLENHFLDVWMDSLKQSGIQYINGDIIADASIYEEQTIPNTWVWEDIGNYFGAGACALSVYDNMFRIHMSSPVEPNQQTQILYTEPDIPGIKFKNQVISSEIQKDRAYVFGSPMDNDRTIRGTIPFGRSDFEIKASIPNPPSLLGLQLKQKLNSLGICISGKVHVLTTSKYNHITFPIAETLSPTLIEIIDVTNHESVNLFAEHLLKHLAYVETGLGSIEKGLEIVTDFWNEKGIGESGFFMADGSGLSRFNAITARQIVDVLAYLKTYSPEGDAFIDSLPTVPNGTLYYFHARNFPNNSLHAKSGSMTRVRCFAGQITMSSGKDALFAIFLNNFSCSQSEAIQSIENLLTEIRNY